jgi:hypothetical protein
MRIEASAQTIGRQRGTRRLATCVASLAAALSFLLALVLASGAPPAHATAKQLRASCIILGASGFPGIPDAGPETNLSFNACEAGQCFESVTDPDSGAFLCHYARNAFIAVGCPGTAKRAQALVSRLIRHAGYHRLGKLKVDAAAIHVSANTALLVMALGNETVELILNAGSDDNPDPIWDGVKQDAIEAARNFNQAWRHLHNRIC